MTTELSETNPTKTEYRSTGVRAIDRLLGGKGWAIPSIVLLSGIAGVGKSRLLRHLSLKEMGREETLDQIRSENESVAAVVLGHDDRDLQEVMHDVDVALVLTRNARLNRLELRCEDKNRFGRVDPDLFVAFDENHERFTLMRTKRAPKAAESPRCGTLISSPDGAVPCPFPRACPMHAGADADR